MLVLKSKGMSNIFFFVTFLLVVIHKAAVQRAEFCKKSIGVIRCKYSLATSFERNYTFPSSTLE